jgi:RNA polymerase sigma-70 factor (ECF subfamily)
MDSQCQARFKEVVPPHLGDAYALARRLTGSQVDSEDIVQESCLRAFRGITRFDGRNSRAWLLTIVRHTAYDWLRSNRRAPQTVEDLEDLEGLAEELGCQQEGANLETALVQEQQAAQIKCAVQALPVLFRQVLLLRYREGLTYREIAECTGIPAGTVMSRLSRAHRHLAVLISTESQGVEVAQERCQVSPARRSQLDRARLCQTTNPVPGAEVLEQRGGERSSEMVAALRPVEARKNHPTPVSGQGLAIEADRRQSLATRRRNPINAALEGHIPPLQQRVVQSDAELSGEMPIAGASVTQGAMRVAVPERIAD